MILSPHSRAKLRVSARLSQYSALSPAEPSCSDGRSMVIATQDITMQIIMKVSNTRCLVILMHAARNLLVTGMLRTISGTSSS